ncbi:unnamed protein product [Dracunculus medinensis]|uniref:Putative alpha-L-fucosidase n=1 Tax=Dracunculus medinensis TaxID=318479 RepID=A0A0N4U8F3_DRAME|nr:unnamed protein product [Dracunculus medinensis]
MSLTLIIFLISLLHSAKSEFSDKLKSAKYEPTWESIDSRPIPLWYQKAKFGIFCHWGVYSVPAFKSEWFWWQWKTARNLAVLEFMRKNYRPETTYADFAHEFTAEFFDANKFREIVEASGAKYFVFTSKHHEGYTMWPSKTSWNWNSVDVGPKKDIVGELKTAFSSAGIHFGLYFSLFEFFNPYYIQDQQKNTSDYVERRSYPQLLELVNIYEPELIWSDGDWEMSENYWKSKEFLAWLYNESPIKDNVVVNDRWGTGVMGNHGGFLTYSDNFNPGHLLPRKWENCMTLDKYSWGFRKNLESSDVRNVSQLIRELVTTIACNGNFLLNVGPNKYGIIPAIFEDRLRELGKWVNRNKDAIFDTYPWMYQNDSVDIWYTVSLPNSNVIRSSLAWTKHTKGSKLYVFFLEFPAKNKVELPSVLFTEQIKAAVLLDNDLSEEIPIIGSKGKPIILNFSSHQRLIRYNQIVVRIENFDAIYHDPIKYLTKHRIIDANKKFQTINIHNVRRK